jgi:hypothetical protein
MDKRVLSLTHPLTGRRNTLRSRVWGAKLEELGHAAHALYWPQLLLWINFLSVDKLAPASLVGCCEGQGPHGEGGLVQSCSQVLSMLTD